MMPLNDGDNLNNIADSQSVIDKVCDPALININLTKEERNALPWKTFLIYKQIIYSFFLEQLCLEWVLQAKMV